MIGFNASVQGLAFHGRRHLRLKHAGRMEDFTPEELQAIIEESKALRASAHAEDEELAKPKPDVEIESVKRRCRGKGKH